MSPKSRSFWPLAALLVLADCATKQLAVEHLTPLLPHAVVGEVVQFTLAYNTGAAMSISIGNYSRLVFSLLAGGALVVLGRIYRQADPKDVGLAVALALICGGALGNLLDRLRSSSGVVDFIDVGLGAHRFYVFNVADMGVTIGAALLALLLWRRDADREPAPERVRDSLQSDIDGSAGRG